MALGIFEIMAFKAVVVAAAFELKEARKRRLLRLRDGERPADQRPERGPVIKALPKRA
jgi:hypothetical protein